MVDSFEELQTVIEQAIKGRGRIVSHTGVFSAGRLHFHGPTYPNQLYREQKTFLQQVDESLVPKSDDATRKYLWVLGQHEVVQNATIELWADGVMSKEDIVVRERLPDDFEISEFTFAELAERDFTRNYYRLTDGTDMSWLEEPNSAMIASLQGYQDQDIEGSLAEFKRETAGIPEEILAPYSIEWDSTTDY